MSTTSIATSTRPLARRWVGLQRAVAVGQVVVFASIMLLVRGQLIPPLAVAAGVFAAGALASLRAPRSGAVIVGGMSALWLASNIAFASQVIPDLLAVAESQIFVPTFAMNVLAVAGTLGLAGAVWRLPGRIAAYALWIAGAVLAVGALATVLARLA